ncbi:GMC family oxidoreductase N-terminal domain-containing protein, partial [Lysinibacillus sp. D4B1_S16]|uniref:GMC family oxidoreductase N-terminal domain-containing protein n=1 Tax=Lysinibacillus sp. D4B1_S16 TaxID=2941231 RepID=UPI0020C02849
MTYRFLPYDFQIKTLTDKRYGPNKLGPDYLIQDWGLTYDQLEPYMDKFEKTAGIPGDDKNTFSGKRSNPYPTGPMKKTPMLKQFEKAAQDLKLTPYMVPSANVSEVYKNPYGETINGCQYCGFCERFGCEYGAKSSAEITVVPTALKTGNFDLRYNSNVVEILKQGSKVTGVRYIDTVAILDYSGRIKNQHLPTIGYR